MRLPLLGQIPIVQSIRESGDEGLPSASGTGTVADAFMHLAKNVISEVQRRNTEKPPTEKVEIKHS
jgi:ATP-binding protein involved in chromosome partitioning